MLARPIVLLIALAATAAGCVTLPADETEAAAADLAAAAALAPVTDTFDGDILLSTATPVRTLNNGGAFSTVLEVKKNTTGVILELEWDAVSPASQQLSMWVRPAGSGSLTVPPDPAILTTGAPLAKADGASPLRLALPADLFPEAGDYDVVIRASAQPVGVAVNQPFTIHITTFADMAFDDAYSALAEGHHATA